MAQTTIKKNAKGYNYKYTDIAEIHNYLEEKGITYYQYIERDGDDDYIFTVPTINGEEKQPRRGCRVVIAPFDKKSNPAQEQGSGITYARRYSLLMAFGLATADDDAQCMTRELGESKPKAGKKEELPKVDAEVVTEESGPVPGYPSIEIMQGIVRKHYPEGSANLQRLLETFHADSIEVMSKEQLAAVYDKFGGR